MSDYFRYYAEANLVCFVIFGIMLVHDLRNVDRQEKQVKYDRALIAFMLYFISDGLWAGVDSGFLPRTRFSLFATNFSNYVIMAAVTYAWLCYVMALEKAPHRERPINKIAVLFPFLVSTVILLVVFFVSPRSLVNDALEIQPIVYVFLVAVPYIYIVTVIIYAVRKARTEKNPEERRKHLYVGFFPLIVIVGGFVEMVFLPTTPVFCFSCTILMLVFYIRSMETQISIDPLTQLNNRGQLQRYVSQLSNTHTEGRLTFVVMMDINDFKVVNDTYGHAAGDKALTIVADSLIRVVGGRDIPAFLGRYGGDEFVLIAHPGEAGEIEALIGEIRARIEAACREEGMPYLLSIGVGCEALGREDSVQKCMQRADRKLYQNKAELKKSGRSTVCR